MNTKQVFKNLAILFVFAIGFFSIYSFTTIDTDTNDLTSYDQSFYQDVEHNNMSSFNTLTENVKCGGDKNAKDAKKDKDSKCGDGSATDKSSATEGKCGDDKKSEEIKTGEEKEMKCGEGKCGNDKKEEKTKEGVKKANEGKDAKCGAGKCG